MRIVQLANAYSPTSGGVRTVLDELGRGYRAAGHERILVIPGRHHTRVAGPTGLVVTLPGVPVTGGYRMIPRFAPVRRLLAELEPDSVEVSDKSTLAAAGPWARERGIGAVLISHERLDAITAARFPHVWRAGSRVLRPALRRRGDRLAESFDAIVVASDFAGAEFGGWEAIPGDAARRDLAALAERPCAAAPRRPSIAPGPAARLHRIPLGVDLDRFRPVADPRPAPGTPPPVRLIHCGRLSAEKNPDLAIATVRALTAAGVAVHLDVYGTGSRRAALERAAADLPVTFHGHLADRSALAARLAAADVALCPGPAETFGLSVLEAMACGTPVVTVTTGGARELLTTGAGLAAPATGADQATAVTRILTWPNRRAAARARAEQFPWSATVAALLDLHAELSARPGAGRLRLVRAEPAGRPEPESGRDHATVGRW